MKITTDEFNFVNLLSPADRNGATFATPGVNMKDYESAIFLFNFGSLAGTLSLDVRACTSAAQAGDTSMAFKYRVTGATTPSTVGNDTWGVRTAVAKDTTLACGGLDNMLLAVEVNSEDLADGYPYVSVELIASGAATLVSAIAIMKPRYPQLNMITALS